MMRSDTGPAVCVHALPGPGTVPRRVSEAPDRGDSKYSNGENG